MFRQLKMFTKLFQLGRSNSKLCFLWWQKLISLLSLFCLPNASFQQVLWSFSLSCIVQKSLKDLRCIYVLTLGSLLVWFPPCFIPFPSISSYLENLKVHPLTLQAKRIVLYCLSSSYPIACGQDSALRKKAKNLWLSLRMTSFFMGWILPSFCFLSSHHYH